MANVTCPQCGSDMVPSPVPDRREFVKAQTAVGSSAEYAASKIDAMHEKQAEHGVIHTCGKCRYVMRVPVAAPAAKKGQAA